MAEGVNLWDLAAKISADTSQSDKALTETQKKVLALAKDFQKLDKPRVAVPGLSKLDNELKRINDSAKATGATVQRDLTGSLSQLSPRLAALTAGPLPALAAGMTALTAGITAVGAAVYASLTDFAAFGSSISDLSVKTGLGAESLTSLKFAAEQGGSSLDRLTDGLTRFSVTVGEAARGSDQAKDKLRALGIEPQEAILNLDTALGKVFKRINEAPAGIARVTLAADAFGKRAGADLLPIIDAMNGDFAELKRRAAELGLTMKDETAAAADKLDDMFNQLTLQAKGLSYQFAQQLAPDVTQALQQISAELAANKGAAAEWGNALAEVLRGARAVATSEIGMIIRDLTGLTVALNPVVLGLKLLREYGASQPTYGEDPFGPGGAMRGGRKTLPGTPEYKAEIQRLEKLKNLGADIFAPSRAGGGGGGRKTERDFGADLLKQLQDQFRSLTLETELQKTAAKLLGDEYTKLDPKVRHLILLEAQKIDTFKQNTEASQVYQSWLREQNEAIAQLTGNTKGYTDRLKDLTEGITKTGGKVAGLNVEWASFNAMYATAAEHIIKFRSELDNLDLSLISHAPKLHVLADEYRNFLDVLGETQKFNRDLAAAIDRELGGLAPPSIDLLGGTQKQFEEFQAKINEWATGLTWTLDQAIYDGLTRGAGRGFASLGIGLLDLLRNHFLKQLHESLVEMLSSVFSRTGSKKGGLLSTIIGLVGPLVGGSVGGGSAGGAGGFGGSFVGFAEGGFMVPNSFGLVGERGPEIVRAGPTGVSVTPLEHSNRFPITVNIYAKDIQGASSRETMAQLERRLLQAVQRAGSS